MRTFLVTILALIGSATVVTIGRMTWSLAKDMSIVAMTTLYCFLTFFAIIMVGFGVKGHNVVESCIGVGAFLIALWALAAAAS